MRLLSAPRHSRVLPEQAPGSERRAAPRLRPLHASGRSLPHLPTALSPPHPSSTCRQRAWHPRGTAQLSQTTSLPHALAPVASHLSTSLGISARVEQGEGTGGAGRSRGWRRRFPGLLPGWGLCPLTRGCFHLTATPRDGNGALSLPSTEPCPVPAPVPDEASPMPQLHVGGPWRAPGPCPFCP